MNMPRLYFAALVSIFLASCTSTSFNSTAFWPSDAEIEQYNAMMPFPEQITCSREREMGSRFSRRACYRMSDLQTRHEATQSLVEEIRESSRLYSANSF